MARDSGETESERGGRRGREVVLAGGGGGLFAEKDRVRTLAGKGQTAAGTQCGGGSLPLFLSEGVRVTQRRDWAWPRSPEAAIVSHIIYYRKRAL